MKLNSFDLRRRVEMTYERLHRLAAHVRCGHLHRGQCRTNEAAGDVVVKTHHRYLVWDLDPRIGESGHCAQGVAVGRGENSSGRQPGCAHRRDTLIGIRLTTQPIADFCLDLFVDALEESHHALAALMKAASSAPTLREMLPLLAFTGLFVLVYAGEAIKYGFLLIYMEEQLGIDPALRGAVIGIQPLIELIIMPFSVVLGRRIGILWLMCIGAALGLGANLCFALWGDVVGMFVGQILMGGVWGFFMVLGIIIAQRLLPSAVATASAIFMSASALSMALGGVAGGLGVAAFGLPSVFFIPALCSLAAVIGLAAMARLYDFR